MHVVMNLILYKICYNKETCVYQNTYEIYVSILCIPTNNTIGLKPLNNKLIRDISKIVIYYMHIH